MRNNSWTLAPRLTGRLSASDQVTIRAMLWTLEQRGQVQAAGAATNTASAGVTSSAIDSHTPWTYDRTMYHLAADWTHRFANAKLDSTVMFERDSNAYRSRTERSEVQASGVTTRDSAFISDQRESSFLATSKLAGTAGDTIWTIGTEFDLRRNEVNTTTTTAGVPVPQDVTATIRRSALWAQSELPLAALNTTMTAGLRAQGYAISGETGSATLDYREWFWQPSLNSRTQLSPDTQLRWNLARVTRAPRVWELLERVLPNLSSNGPNTPNFIGNANLKPEATISADIGIDHRLAQSERSGSNGSIPSAGQTGQSGQTGQIGINLFARSQTDVIARRLFLQSSTWLEQPDNVGDAIVWGLESDLRHDLAWAGLPPDWTLAANASLLQSRMRSGDTVGSRIPGQARYLANLTIAKPLRSSGGWYGGGTLALVGAADLNTPGGDGILVTGRQRSYAQLDLYVGSVIRNWGFWRLNLYNVSDFRRDVSRVITDANGIVYADHTVQRLTPRVFLTVGTKF